jgi:hypothetical protein
MGEVEALAALDCCDVAGLWVDASEAAFGEILCGEFATLDAGDVFEGAVEAVDAAMSLLQPGAFGSAAAVRMVCASGALPAGS